MFLLKESWEAYSFSQNCDQNCKISDTLVFFNFFCRISWYCFCNISDIIAPLCLKIFTKVSVFVLFPTLQVWAELVSPIGTYDSFPNVTYFRTFQHSELVRTTMCHCFTLGVWKFYQKNYSSFPIWNILQNLIWTFVAWDIEIIHRCVV